MSLPQDAAFLPPQGEWTTGEAAAFRLGLLHAAMLARIEAEQGGSAERAASRILRLVDQPHVRSGE